MSIDDLFNADGAEIRVRCYSDRVEAVYISETGRPHGSAAVARRSRTDDLDIVERAMAEANSNAGDASGEAEHAALRMLDRWERECEAHADERARRRALAEERAVRHGGRY
jgi:hypothetical protein